MTDYAKIVNFAVKDGYTSGNPLKTVKGTEINTELDNVQTHVATKANKITSATNDNLVAMDANGDIKDGATALIETIYPVGSIYISTSATNPGTTFGVGTWSALGDKQTLVQAGTYAAASTGGSSTAINVSHQHGIGSYAATSGAHSHVIDGRTTSGGSTTNAGVINLGSVTNTDPNNISTNTDGTHSHTMSGTSASAGSSGADANMPPYLAVYIWQRDA